MGRHKRSQSGYKARVAKKQGPTIKSRAAQNAIERFGVHSRIFGAFEAGASHAHIMQTYGVTNRTSKRLKKRWRSGADAHRVSGTGKLRKTTARTDRRIVNIAISAHSPTAEEIAEEMRAHFEMKLTPKTIRQRLGEAGYARCVRAKKPRVDEKNRKRRLKWAKLHLHWTLDQWKTVLWSDESSFFFRFKDRPMVWRRKHEKFNPRCLAGTVKADKKKLMVWGCFAWDGLGLLCQVKGIINGPIYKKILQTYMIPSGERLFQGSDHFIFQDDNAPVHSPAKKFLDEKDFTRMVWPAQSPDLNPIENLWFLLDQQMKGRKPRTADEFFQIIQVAWNDFTVEKCHHLVESMHHRCTLVIKAKGYSIDY